MIFYFTPAVINLGDRPVGTWMGTIVYDRNVESDNELVNMSQYESGVYMIRIVTDNGVLT